MSTSVAFEPQAANDRCPWCGTFIARDRFIEIKAKIADLERKKLAKELAGMEQEFRAEAQELEARFTRDGEKRVAAITVERDQATAKIKALEAREAAIRKETAAHTEASVKAEAEKKLKVLLIEREKATAKIKQLEETTQNGIDEARIAFAKD